MTNIVLNNEQVSAAAIFVYRLVKLGITVAIAVFICAHTEVSAQGIAISTADEETISLTNDYLGADQLNALDPQGKNTGELTNAARNLFSTTIFPSENDQGRNKDYCVIHIIRWKTTNGKTDIERQLWALFKKIDDRWVPQLDEKDKSVYSSRIFGGKRVYVLLVNVNVREDWDVAYKVSVIQKIPAPLQNLITLLNPVQTANAPDSVNESSKWGARLMLIRYRASDFAVSLKRINGTSVSVELPKEIIKVYDNEGKYYWDASLGVPLNSVKELQFSSEGNRVTTGAKDRQNAYGFLNVYPFKVDTKAEKILNPPHLVFGLPLAGKPLHRPFVGLGYGVTKPVIKFNLFAGVVFNRERVPRTLKSGDPATAGQLEADLHSRWVRKFMFGINFPVSQIKNALKK